MNFKFASLLLLSFTISNDVAFAERPNIVLILADDLGYSDLGCYGGEIRTPHLDRLAANGLRMTQMYNTARCCSTRASLLTGLYPHQAGVGAMTADHHKPGYRGFLTDRCVTITSVLRQHGYQTFMSGKWHLRGQGNQECIPTNHGFDEFFGHFRAYASFFRPDLFIRLPKNRKQPNYNFDEFYATDAIADHAVEFLKQSQKKDSPFFLFLSFNAPHFPLHAPKKKIDAYHDTYTKGWDVVRKLRYQRMVDQKIIPPQYALSVRGHVTKVPNRNRNSPYFDQPIPAWNELSNDRKKDLARRMAIYAAMVEIMDRNIGRVVGQLREQGEFENTLIAFLSDNGACAEWDPFGFDDNPYPVNRLHRGKELERMGQKGTFHSYGTGWANVSNTPFRLYKHYNHEGGISTPLIMHWPRGIERVNQIDRRPLHIVDFAATFLELGNAKYPAVYNGHKVLPLVGNSLVPVFHNRPTKTRPLFFEHEGNRAVRWGKWKIVWTNYSKRWELYDIDSDRSETNDLASRFPNRVHEMNRLWKDWAASHFVESEQVKQPETGMPKIYYAK